MAGGQAARTAQVARVDRAAQAARSSLPPARVTPRVRQVRRVPRDQRPLELVRQEQRRIWQRTAAKRAARQVETEQAILEREQRLRASREEPPPYGREPESYEGYVRRRTAEAREATVAVGARSAALDDLWTTALAAS